MTLTDFLLARIAEDETGHGEVHAYDCGDLEYLQFYGWRPGEPMNCDCGYPARVLAECTAQRRIIEDNRGCTWGCSDEPNCHDCITIANLASVYSEHPDYREEWRP